MGNLALSTMSSDPMLAGPKRARDPLDVLITPHSVAVIGAGEQPASRRCILLWNLISSPFGGTIYPVIPRHAGILCTKTYPTLADVPDRVDLAVIATPAATVPQVTTECVAAGIKRAIIISVGFKEDVQGPHPGLAAA